MLNVAYVTPYFTANTVKFIEAIIMLPNVRLILIAQEPLEKLPDWQQSRVSVFKQVQDVFDKWTLIKVLTDLQKQLGTIDRVLGATEQLQVPMAEARQTLGISGMDPEAAQNFRDKSRMKTLFRENKIPCAHHTLTTNWEEAASFARSIGYPVVVKPQAGAGSQTTFRISNDQEMLNAFSTLAHKAAEGVVVEEFIQGDEFSFDTFMHNGKTLGATINTYNPTPLEVMANPWIQWRVTLRKENKGKAFDEIRKTAKKVHEVLGMKTGMSHMEWFRRKDGSIAVSEIAARPPGAQFTTILSRACDQDILGAWARLMIFDTPFTPDVKYNAGAVYLRGQGEGNITHVEGLQALRSKYADIITDIRIPKPGHGKALNYEGEGFVIVRHANAEVVENALKDFVENVRVHLG